MTKPNYSAYSGTETTLAGLIERLSHYISLLKNLAQYLALTAAAELALASEKLEDITEALLNIEIMEPELVGSTDDNGKLKPGATVTVPVGYNKEEVVYTVAAISETTNVEAEKTPEGSDIVEGKEAWANGEVVSGTLTDNSGKIVTGTTATGAADNDAIAGKLVVTIPTAKYDSSSIINTNIDVLTDYEYDAKVTVVKTAEGETAVKKSFDIPAGYYAEAIKVTPVFEATDKTYESEINVLDITINASGTVSPEDGYDYIENVTVAKAVLGGASAALELSIDAAEATVSVPVSTKGYTDDSSYTVYLKANDAITKDTTAKATGDIVITPSVSDAQSVTVKAGLYKNDTVIKVDSMTAGETLTADDITVKSVTENASDSSKFTVTAKVGKSGYIAQGDYIASDINKSDITVSNLGTGTAAKEILAKSFTVSNTEGYTASGSESYTVKEAVITDGTIAAGNINTTTGAITVPVTAGWVSEDISLQLPVTKSPDTVVPGDSESRIAKGTYLTGELIVEAVSSANNSLNYDGIKNEEDGKKTITPASSATYMKQASVDLSGLVDALAAL